MTMFKQLNTYGYISASQEDTGTGTQSRTGFRFVSNDINKFWDYYYREIFFVKDGDYVFMNILYSKFARSYPCEARVNC